MGDTKIEWTDKTWNPVTGCTKVSQGCRFCYAERIAGRMWATQYPANADGSPRRFTDVRCHPDRLNQPNTWRDPAMVFVNSMSDLFHEDVPDEFIGRVWSKMLETPRHTFQVLTKRPERMRDIVTRLVDECRRKGLREAENIWLGVSCEDQAAADKRIPLLLQTPAHVRFVSAEPLLGPIDLNKRELICADWRKGVTIGTYLDWVIVGGESGPGARPMRADWARGIRDQCQAAGVAFFFKQWGEHNVNGVKVSKQTAGRLLDGRTWDEFPQRVTA